MAVIKYEMENGNGDLWQPRNTFTKPKFFGKLINQVLRNDLEFSEYGGERTQ